METVNPERSGKIQKLAKAIKRAGLTGLVVIAAAIVSLGSFYNIEEQEQAVLTTFGVAKNVSEPGLHFKIPVIQKVQKVNIIK